MDKNLLLTLIVGGSLVYFQNFFTRLNSKFNEKLKNQLNYENARFELGLQVWKVQANQLASHHKTILLKFNFDLIEFPQTAKFTKMEIKF